VLTYAVHTAQSVTLFLTLRK